MQLFQQHSMINSSFEYAKCVELSFPHFYAKNTTQGLHLIGMAHMCVNPTRLHV